MALIEGPVPVAFPREVCDLQRKDVNFDLIKVRENHLKLLGAKGEGILFLVLEVGEVEKCQDMSRICQDLSKEFNRNIRGAFSRPFGVRQQVEGKVGGKLEDEPLSIAQCHPSGKLGSLQTEAFNGKVIQLIMGGFPFRHRGTPSHHFCLGFSQKSTIQLLEYPL